MGPYPLRNRRPGAQRATTSALHASPVEITVFSSGSSARGVAASAEGVNLACVTRSLRSRARRSSPGIIASREATTSVAPLHSAVKRSSTDASKCSGAKKSTRAPSPMRYAAVKARMALHTPRCGTMTPLGRPVEPEV